MSKLQMPPIPIDNWYLQGFYSVRTDSNILVNIKKHRYLNH